METQEKREKEDIRNHIQHNSKTNDYRHGQYKITCPSCQKERTKNRGDTPLSVNINAETIVYHCHHCGIQGAMSRTQGTTMKVIKTEPKRKEIKLPIALGKSISGMPIVGDLTSMPHLLIAGTTGSGKSVCINTIIVSLLYKLNPDLCKFILIDPKMLELSTYEGIPPVSYTHLTLPTTPYV